MEKLTSEEIKYFYDLLIEHDKAFLKTLKYYNKDHYSFSLYCGYLDRFYESENKNSSYPDCHYVHAYYDGANCDFYVPFDKDEERFKEICYRLFKAYVIRVNKRDRENRYQQYLKLKKEFEGK